MSILQRDFSNHGLLETINLIKYLIIYKKGGEKAKKVMNYLGNGSGLLAQGNGKNKRADRKGQPAPTNHIKNKFFSAGCQVVGKRSVS